MSVVFLIIGLVLLWFALPELYKQKVIYRTRYYFGKVVALFGFCANCWIRVNVTGKGRKICPNCKKTR
jgi:hypothetical protein